MFPKSQSTSSFTSNSHDLDNHIFLINEYVTRDDKLLICFFARCEKQRVKICGEFKKLTDRLHDINFSEKRMVDDLSSSTAIVNNNPDEVHLVIDKWKQMATNNGANRKDVITITNKTIIDPLQKYHIALNEVKNVIKKYEQLLIDSQRYAQKVTKYKACERTSTNLLKLNEYEQLLENARKDSNHLRLLLEKELPLFYQKRIEYFQPSLISFIGSQIYYFQKCFALIEDFNLVERDYSEKALQDSQTDALKAIDSLSIVST